MECTPKHTTVEEHLINQGNHIATCVYACQLPFSAIPYLFMVISSHDLFLSMTSVDDRNQCWLINMLLFVREQASYLVATWLHCFFFFSQNWQSIFYLLEKLILVCLLSFWYSVHTVICGFSYLILCPATSHNVAFNNSKIINKRTNEQHFEEVHGLTIHRSFRKSRNRILKYQLYCQIGNNNFTCLGTNFKKYAMHLDYAS